jgi:phosphoribosylformylglycinamidine synthase
VRFAVVVFPGSNCDIDALKAIEDVIAQPVDAVWHETQSLAGYDCVFIPGGFSYGDYLRCGALARFSPVMAAVRQAADEGRFVVGVCNGFQILTEAGLLPGALRRNQSLKFTCDITPLTVENTNTPFTRDYRVGQQIHIPIAHGEGNYYADQGTLTTLNKNGQIVFRYVENPNGSIENIAGICNERRNVLGMMPHPERAVHDWLGSSDGRSLFTSLLRYWRENLA